MDFAQHQNARLRRRMLKKNSLHLMGKGDGLCDFCLVPENVYHYLLDCIDYNVEQDLLTHEKDAFTEYAKTNRQPLYDRIYDKNISDEELIQTIIYDKRFALTLDSIPSYSNEWSNKRRELNRVLESSSTHQYAFYMNFIVNEMQSLIF